MATTGAARPSRLTWEVDVPPGWEPVAEVCRELWEERSRIAEHIDSEIRREIKEFEERTGAISPRDQSWATTGSVANFLRGVAEGVRDRDEDLAFQRLVGRRAAMGGLPLQALITSYHIGFRELWSTLAERATGREAAGLLFERGAIVWERLLSSATAVSEGYQEEMARRGAFESSATAHLIEIVEQNPDDPQASAVAAELGFDPSGSFQLIALGGPIAVGDTARSLTSSFQLRGAMVASTQRGRTSVLIVQGLADAAITSLLEALPAATAAGVGGRAKGIRGLLASLVEAEQALRVAVDRGHICFYEDEWLIASLMSQRESVQRVLAPGIAAALSNQHLVEALRTFATSGFSVAESARILGYSANSVRYRLTRWRELTGWDPWKFDGLAKSMVALGLAGIPASG